MQKKQTSNNVPIESARKMMEYKSIRTTQRYAKVTKRKLTNNMKALRRNLIQLPAPTLELKLSQAAG